MTRKRRNGFTLIELVVVVLVLGILAAIAAPKLLDITGDARANSSRQSLTVIRDAVEVYRMNSGHYPSADTLVESVREYMHGTFPAPEVGDTAGDNTVRAFSGPLVPTGTQGWAFDADEGDFRINSAPYDAW